MSDERALRAQMVEVGRRLWLRGLIAGAEGNFSARLDGQRLLCTPSGLNKGFLRDEDLVVTDLCGVQLFAAAPAGGEAGQPDAVRAPSTELLLHLACYQERSDCLAVVHAHPPHAVALTLAGEALVPCLPEAVTALGPVPTAPYATPGGAQVAEAVRPFLRDAACVLLERHGALAISFAADARTALTDACDKLEMLEAVARVQLLSGLRRPVTALPDEALRALRRPAPRRPSALE